MRIISGSAKGTKLNTISEKITRPTLDRVKEPLFSIIQNRILNSKVLDLFAGSGALGLEALSRGAEIAYLCDKSHKAIDIIEKNAEKTNLINKSVIIHNDYTRTIEKMKETKFDIIFIDPPYNENIAVKSVELIIDNKILAENGIIILETDDANRELNELKNINNIQIYDNRSYGRVTLLFISERS